MSQEENSLKRGHRNVAILVMVILFLVGCLWGTLVGGAGMWMILR